MSGLYKEEPLGEEQSKPCIGEFGIEGWVCQPYHETGENWGMLGQLCKKPFPLASGTSYTDKEKFSEFIRKRLYSWLKEGFSTHSQFRTGSSHVEQWSTCRAWSQVDTENHCRQMWREIASCSSSVKLRSGVAKAGKMDLIKSQCRFLSNYRPKTRKFL